MINKELTLAELANLTQSKLVGNSTYKINNVADLESATTHDVSFLSNPRYEQAMRKSEAGAIFISPAIAINDQKNYLISDDPSRSFQKAVELFFDATAAISGFPDIHPTAVIHPTVKLGKNVKIGPHTVIDKNCIIGDNTEIGPLCSLSPHVTLGDECHLYAHVTIREHCILGNRVILQPGVVIGSCGFGYTTSKEGKHTKLNQVGSVKIEDDVEIGANTTIDRARFKTTFIGKGTKIDNLVQIGHGVRIGRDNIIVAQTGIAGSSETGNNVTIGGQVAVNGHIKLDDGVMVSARSGVSKSLPKGKYGGVPTMPLHEYNRNAVFLRNIEEYIKAIHTRLANLEKDEG